MATLKQIAAWNSEQNPLEHVLGGGGICPTILAKPQDMTSRTMILISQDFDDPQKNLRGWYMEKAKIKTANVRGYVGHGVAQTIDTAGGEGQGVIIFDAYNHRDISANETAGTITTNTPTANKCGTFYVGQPPRYRIRKLTERECFRLMGVKDEDSDRIAKNQVKTSMYHLSGDSIVTACLMAIMGEMFDVDWREKIKELQESITNESRRTSETISRDT